MFKEYFRGIIKDRFILFSLVNRDLIQKYRRSVLGVAWSILTPLGLAIIIGGIYAILFNADPMVLIPLIFAGINPWSFMSGTAEGATFAFMSAEGYIKQSTVNAQIFPLRTTITGFINLMYSIITYFTLYLFLKPQLFGPKMLMVVPGLLIVFIFSWALANFTSIINLYLRDFQPFQSLVLQGLFYVTPIIYSVDMLKERGFDYIYQYNPFYYMLEVIRKPMMGEELPGPGTYLIALVIALVLYLLSIVVIMRNKKAIAYML